MEPASLSAFGEAIKWWLRYVILTRRLFYLLAYGKGSDSAANKLIDRMLDAHVLDSLPLIGRELAYTPSKKARRELGQPKRKAPGVKTIAWYIAAACYAVQDGHVINTPPETEELGPDLFGGPWPRGLSSSFCYTEEIGEDVRFCILVFDGPSDIRRIKKKIEKLFHRLEANEAARAHVKSGLIHVVVLTGKEPRAEKIRRLRLPRPISVFVVPKLGDLIRG
jgi:hypothetical protein